MDELRRSSDRTCVVLHDGRMAVRTVRATSDEELGAALDGDTLLGVLIPRGEIAPLVMPLQSHGHDSVEGLRGRWIKRCPGEPLRARLSADHGADVQQGELRVSWAQPSSHRPLHEDLRYKELQPGDRRIPLMVDACLKLLQPLADLSRDEMRERSIALWDSEALDSFLSGTHAGDGRQARLRNR